MLYNNTLVFILLILFVVIAIDIIPQWYTWQSRIYIGRYANREVWTEKVMRKAIQWLKNTPTIHLTDNKRLIII